MQSVLEGQVRSMTLSDLADVIKIDKLSFPIPWSEKTYRLELTENPAAHLFIAERPDLEPRELIGYIGFWYIVDEAHISTLAVHPTYRRRGVGEHLLRYSLKEAAELGAELMTLEVRVSNLAAINLYEKYGFTAFGTRKRYYHDNGEDALQMRLADLTQWRVVALGGGE